MCKSIQTSKNSLTKSSQTTSNFLEGELPPLRAPAEDDPVEGAAHSPEHVGQLGELPLRAPAEEDDLVEGVAHSPEHAGMPEASSSTSAAHPMVPE